MFFILFCLAYACEIPLYCYTDIVAYFYWCVKYPIIQTQHIYPFYCKWAFDVFLLWVYYKQYYKYSFTYILSCMCLYFSRYISRSRITRYWVCVSSILPAVKLFSKFSFQTVTNFCCGNWPSSATPGNRSIFTIQNY